MWPMLPCVRIQYNRPHGIVTFRSPRRDGDGSNPSVCTTRTIKSSGGPASIDVVSWDVMVHNKITAKIIDCRKQNR